MSRVQSHVNTALPASLVDAAEPKNKHSIGIHMYALQDD